VAYKVTTKRKHSYSVATNLINMARDDWEWIDRAPKVKEFREPKIHVRWITPDEAQRLISALTRT